MRKLFAIAIFFFANIVTAQLKKNVDYTKIVLNKSIIGKKFVFGKWDEKGNDELELTYLGKLKGKNKTYKIMTSIWSWGISGRATSRILIFDINNKYLGNYYFTMTCDVPKRITNNYLQFQSVCEENKNKSITNISFLKGIPKHLITKDGGLISSFEKE